MPRKYLGRIPKRRRHSSNQQTAIRSNNNRNNNSNLSQNLSVFSNNNVDVQSESPHFSHVSTNSLQMKIPIPIPPIPTNPHSNLEVIIDDNIQQQTDLPTDIQIQNSSSTISSMTTSLFDTHVSSAHTDELF